MSVEVQIAKEMQLVENENKFNQFKTELYKKNVINELRGGLGAKIKANPNGIKMIKKPWYVKLKQILTKIFTRF